MKLNTGGLKVLLLDIETAPNLGFIWGKYEQNVIEFEQERYILSFSYKWLGDSKVHGLCLQNFKSYKKDKTNDYELVKKIHEILNEADILIGHNSDKFDLKMLNSAFLIHGLTPTTPAKTIDTLKIARSKFSFNSNKLDDLGKRLGLGEKTDTGGFKLWKGCMDGEISSWKKMVRYNKNDVVLLEKVYLKMAPWAKTHPCMITSGKDFVCQLCNSSKIEQRGWSYSQLFRRKRFVCKECGKWSMGKLEKINK